MERPEHNYSKDPEKPAAILAALKLRGIEYVHSTNTWLVHDGDERHPCKGFGDALDCRLSLAEEAGRRSVQEVE